MGASSVEIPSWSPASREAPRWRNGHSPTESTFPHTCQNELDLEDRFPEEVCNELAKRGHRINLRGAWEGRGSEMMIQTDPDTDVLHGAADPRRDGYAIGW